MVDLSDLLRLEGLEPKDVLVLRHRPPEPELARVLPWLADQRPDLFNAYQSTQNPRAESALSNAVYVAAFVVLDDGRVVFAGLYRNAGWSPMDRDAFRALDAHRELARFGMTGFAEADAGETVRRFDLRLTETFADWKGRLIIDWPPPPIAWHRWADRNVFRVRAILEESALNPPMPDWRELVLGWEELDVLPARWRSALTQWRGIYQIYDASDGMRYVGAAYGGENILGRWQNYAASGHGDNLLLKARDPHQFRFSILERVSPDMMPDDVIRLEATWKRRLHTRDPAGLNSN
ncbi:GIY-YIG nuclease family protein [Minwuia thermotolerans]|uniref:GIY-YIG domain-containing protein n=1 Tax=Minwuia thermotolerans TaxID=2056226 RepID=A0A2M9FY00_9PROT|nr:GIY-YIG nuclease family protein [Minwuia thermotolerans]PJK28324.1 hypothetical protein CVT23_18310 [Minwuia thermotolerans]